MATMEMLKKVKVNADAEVKGDAAMSIAKEIVNKNIANAEVKGETTMETKKNEVITVTINTNTEKQGYEIRFSGTPKANIKNMLISLKFRFYPSLANAWIKKTAKVTDEELKKFVKACEKAGYTVSRTVDGKADEVKKPEIEVVGANAETTKLIIEFLKSQGYTVAEPKTEEKPKKSKAKAKAKTETKAKTESKPKAEKKAEPKTEAKKTAPKLEAKAEVKSNNTKNPKAERKLFVNGEEITRSKSEKPSDDFPF